MITIRWYLKRCGEHQEVPSIHTALSFFNRVEEQKRPSDYMLVSWKDALRWFFTGVVRSFFSFIEMELNVLFFDWTDGSIQTSFPPVPIYPERLQLEKDDRRYLNSRISTMMKHQPLLLTLFILSMTLFESAYAAIRLPAIIGDGMVLQRDVELNVWGWADSGENVAVDFRGDRYTTTTGADGRWQLSMKSLSPGGPEVMKIQGVENGFELKDIYVGDVWVCSGQSNMTHQFNRWQEEYAREIAEANHPEIRQFQVPTTAVLEGALEDVPGAVWRGATPENLMNFTVIGYFFAKQLFNTYHVPQGILMTCVGGTRIEAWTSEAGFQEFPDMLEIIDRNKDTAYVEKVNAEVQAELEAMGPRLSADVGLKGDVKWYDPQFQPKNWKRIYIPGYWEDQGIRNLDGVVWYRREVEIPETMVGVESLVKLGRIVDADTLYINGQKVGETTYQYPQRRYKVPSGVLKAGKNVFVIRVVNYSGKGGFVPDKPYVLEGAGHSVDLKGNWLYRVGEVYQPHGPSKRGISAQEQPSSLYNGMIAPLVKFRIRGILWYQGESNTGNPESYRKLLPNLIRDWRQHWRLGDVPFFIAQLPSCGDVNYLPEASNWALVRDAQLQTAMSVENTGLGINIDLGEWNDLHPGNKKQVGDRLALQAMKLSYGDQNVVASGPVYRAQTIREGKIVLRFDSVGSGLQTSDGEPLAHFAIAGEDGVFEWAKAEIEGDTVVVWSEGVSRPKYVRYAWADNPDFANLANKEGLPATPFRTDH